MSEVCCRHTCDQSRLVAVVLWTVSALGMNTQQTLAHNSTCSCTHMPVCKDTHTHTRMDTYALDFRWQVVRMASTNVGLQEVGRHKFPSADWTLDEGKTQLTN